MPMRFLKMILCSMGKDDDKERTQNLNQMRC